ncbi:MAG: rhodanese-like domain-containing protein [Planctomycetota bacterium]
MSDSSPMPIEVDVHQTAALLKAEDSEFILLDVREQDEYDFASIKGSVLIPMSELQSRIGEIEALGEKHIIVHCHHGGRSLHVTEFLRARGIEKVQNMTGGIDAWSTEINGEVPRY